MLHTVHTSPLVRHLCPARFGQVGRRSRGGKKQRKSVLVQARSRRGIGMGNGSGSSRFFFHGVLNGDHRVRVLSPDHLGPMYGVFANILLMFFYGFQCSSR